MLLASDLVELLVSMKEIQWVGQLGDALVNLSEVLLAALMVRQRELLTEEWLASHSVLLMADQSEYLTGT